MPRNNSKDPPTRKARHVKSENDTSEHAAAAPRYTGDPIFFWKETGENGFLCQWYKCTPKFTDPEHAGLAFNSAEQYMMFRKAMVSKHYPIDLRSPHFADDPTQLFNDTTTAAKIMAEKTPRKQKQLGKEVEDYDDDKWIEARSAIVQRGNWLKFSRCDNTPSMKIGVEGDPVPLKDLLLATRDEQELAEASPFDGVWGIGFKAEEAQGKRSQWGENLLGKALMHVRSELRREQEGSTATSDA